MAYIHSVSITNDQTYLIEPLLFATAGGTSTALTVGKDNFTLAAGAYINVKVGTVGANATLNVNNTGAIAIYYNGVAISANMLTENNIYTFIYDGSHWSIVGDITGKNIMIGTSSEWGEHYNYVAPRGTILIYSDHGTVTATVNNETVTKTVPGIKITDGSTPVVDLPFVGDDIHAAIRSELNDHINDNVKHITAAERTSWNNKITCADTVQNNNLILTRS